MSEPVLIQRQRAVLRDLARLTAERGSADAEIETTFKVRAAAIEKEVQETREKLQVRYEAQSTAAERELQQVRQSVVKLFEAEHAAATREYGETRTHLTRRFEDESERAQKEYQETCWTITTLVEAKKKEAEGPLQEVEQRVAAGLLKVPEIRKEAMETLRRYRQHGKFAAAKVESRRKPSAEPLRDMKKDLTEAAELLTELKGLRSPRFFQGPRIPILLLVLAAAFAVPLFVLYPDGMVAGKVHWLVVSVGAAVLLTLALSGLMYATARLRVQHVWEPLMETLADVEATAQRARELAKKRYEETLANFAKTDQGQSDLKKVKEKFDTLMTTIHQRRDGGLRQAEEKYPRLLAGLTQKRDADLRQADEKQRRLLPELKQRLDSDLRQANEKHQRQLAENKNQYEAGKQALQVKWQQGVAQAQATAASVARECKRLFPDWTDPAWKTWNPPRDVPPAIRFGEYQVAIESPTPTASAPAGAGNWWQSAAPENLTLPALVAFPQRASLTIRARDAGRAQAVQSLQALMLRFLTALPPGKVRFTIIDPVGLGENFAAFMHLADFDEQLVTSRIWTESQHIEQRLADIAQHMENVIQKYLRNQYPSIDAYNAQAGEVAEPFRVLVVANFPVNFSVDAARRLVSIASSGASCGVYTLVTVDTKQPMPDGFNLADLEQAGAALAWKDQRFVWKDPDLGKYPLTLESPPSNEIFTRILQQVGEKAKYANRVEVSFDFIAPQPAQYWASDSRAGIDVPLGRAGATKRQHLRLGHGTAQHVLVAGKTGSGKSTLMHALITNLALCYSPQEIELYLVDFKKGVEFKTYANFELPHARVIAVESEREFGLSVLQRLDAELKRRGDRFRSLNVHDVKGYRDANPNHVCPRIMLLVDEFQEFFTEDDKIAQEAALLLDRLVRQGRAFGLHVLLGSQTLGGAYTLARSTIDQMAVRIALQCSEADAHLILSKDNSAARLLSRPGEAIYNDQNGLLEGNDIFQVVWLPDPRREELLQRVQQMARQKKLPRSSAIVFEGNMPADIDKNPLLTPLLQAAEWPAAPRASYAWLGEAIAIKDPTAAVFRRQTSSNLLLIGQHDEAALGILATSLVSLAAQHAPTKDAPAGARFFVLDGTPADAPHMGFLGRVTQFLPHGVNVGSWREVPPVLTEIAEELDRRQKANEGEQPSIYLIIHGLQRFRDLRKGEDDFGYSRRDEQAATPAQQLATILKEGAAVGIHCLVWCDSLNNLNRSLERQALREFEMRVLFQMSVADSSTLIDTPAASKLGLHRALFHSEEQAQPEKFRPYGLPAATWLEDVKRQLGRRRMVVSTSR
ncbi:MAG: hypothetical protein K2R98_14780 [Gemmataceae bacterium]|nr:hypothetical protein [Gemmataceae bacterium]